MLVEIHGVRPVVSSIFPDCLVAEGLSRIRNQGTHIASALVTSQYLCGKFSIILSLIKLLLSVIQELHPNVSRYILHYQSYNDVCVCIYIDVSK